MLSSTALMQRRLGRRSVSGSRTIPLMDINKFPGTKEYLNEKLEEANMHSHELTLKPEDVEAFRDMLGPAAHVVTMKEADKEALQKLINTHKADFERMCEKLSTIDKQALTAMLDERRLKNPVTIHDEDIPALQKKIDDFFIHHIR